MKRCFSNALALALLIVLALSPLSAAAAEIVGANVETAVGQATETGDTGLTADGATDSPERTAEEPSAEAGEAVPAELEFEIVSAELSAPQIATAIRIDPRSVKIGVREQYTGLSLVTEPAGSAVSGVGWRSDDEQIAAVDPVTGVVTGIKKGTTTITAFTPEGLEASCKVKVRAIPSGIALEPSDVTINKGMTDVLVATVSGGASGTIAFTSSDPQTVAVDENGRITALAAGQATITASTYNNMSASCNVVVDIAPEAVALSPISVTIGVGEAYTMSAQVTPPSGETGCTTRLSWASSNKKIATVNSKGKLKGKKTGNCSIRVTTVNGLEAYSKVKVVKAPSKISISPAVGALRVGKTGKYKITLSPKGSGGSVAYASSNPAIASVDNNGVVTALAPGEVYIGVKTYNGKTAKAKLVVSDVPQDPDIPTSEKVKLVIALARKQVGKPYIYGSGYADDENPRGFDCSGLVYWVFKRVGVTLQDSAYRQGYDARFTRLPMSQLVAGDVIFFNTNTSDGDLSDHSAIYIGNGNFIHASSTAQKVIISNLSTPGSYYNRTFSWGHRVLS